MDLVENLRCDCKTGYTGSHCETGEMSMKFLQSFLFSYTVFLEIIFCKENVVNGQSLESGTKTIQPTHARTEAFV